MHVLPSSQCPWGSVSCCPSPSPLSAARSRGRALGRDGFVQPDPCWRLIVESSRTQQSASQLWGGSCFGCSSCPLGLHVSTALLLGAQLACQHLSSNERSSGAQLACEAEELGDTPNGLGASRIPVRHGDRRLLARRVAWLAAFGRVSPLFLYIPSEAKRSTAQFVAL